MTDRTNRAILGTLSTIVTIPVTVAWRWIVFRDDAEPVTTASS
jgi:hypothetical protein